MIILRVIMSSFSPRVKTRYKSYTSSSSSSSSGRSDFTSGERTSLLPMPLSTWWSSSSTEAIYTRGWAWTCLACRISFNNTLEDPAHGVEHVHRSRARADHALSLNLSLSLSLSRTRTPLRAGTTRRQKVQRDSSSGFTRAIQISQGFLPAEEALVLRTPYYCPCCHSTHARRVDMNRSRWQVTGDSYV